MYDQKIWHKYRVKPPRPHGIVVFDGGKDVGLAKIDAEKRLADKVMDEIKTMEPLEIISGGLPNGELADSSNTKAIIEEIGPKHLSRIRIVNTNKVQCEEISNNLRDFFRRK